MKNFLSVFFVFITGTWVFAQKAPYAPGSKAFSLGMNGVLTYAGNLFSPSFNSLNIPVANNYVYRRFDSETSAHRYEINGIISRNQNQTLTSMSMQSQVNVSFLYGREKHWLYKEVNLYRYYGFGGGFQHSTQYSESLGFDQTINFTRIANGPTFFIPLQLGVGLEYHFANHFFVGAEGGLTGNVSYTAKNSAEFWNEKTPDNTLIRESKDIFGAQVRFLNSLIFRAGFKF